LPFPPEADKPARGGEINKGNGRGGKRKLFKLNKRNRKI
jgi:hypothetical protein